MAIDKFNSIIIGTQNCKLDLKSLLMDDSSKGDNALARQNGQKKPSKANLIDSTESDVMIELPNHCTVLEAIEKVLPYFNQQFDSSNTRLDLDYTLYELYFCKKNGQPKSDYPALDDSQSLDQTGIQSFCIVEKHSEAITGPGTNNKTQDSKRTADSVKASKGAMVDQSMPRQEKAQDKEFLSHKASGSQATETCCFCIPIGGKQGKNEKHISMQVDNQESRALKKALLEDKN